MTCKQVLQPSVCTNAISGIHDLCCCIVFLFIIDCLVMYVENSEMLKQRV